AREASAARTGGPVEQHLRLGARLLVQAVVAELAEAPLALAGREGVLEPLEGGVDVRRRVSAAAHREAHLADERRAHELRGTGVACVGATRVLEEVLDFVDVVAASAAHPRERRAHEPIVSRSARSSARWRP